MQLVYKTVSPILKKVLKRIMREPIFDTFQLVGGTGLSLQLGHRISTDIDLFTSAEYGSIDFDQIDHYLKQAYKYVEISPVKLVGLGRPYFVGDEKEDLLKLDFYYTDNFIYPAIVVDGIRIARLEDIAAMKLEAISNFGRKKDFWDVHELLEKFTLGEMIAMHKKRYPYSHQPHQLKNKLTLADHADDDFDPRCLRAKHWELIKLDLYEEALKL